MKPLEKQFIGKGQVRGFVFTQICAHDRGFLYEVNPGEGLPPHYEVFMKKVNSRFNCISYPGSSCFGKWAWTFKDLEKAKLKLESL